VAVLTQNLDSKLAAKFGTIQTYTVNATEVEIFRGATVVLRLTDGLAYPAVDDIEDTHKQVVVGIARENKKVGSIRVEEVKRIKRDCPGCDQTYVGRIACVKDDQTVQLYGLSTCKVVVGRISEIAVEGVSVFVDLTCRLSRLVVGPYD